MKHIPKQIFSIVVIFFCQKGLAVSVICQPVIEFPWNYETRATYSPSEGQTYYNMYIHTQLDTFWDEESQHNEYTATVANLDDIGGQAWHRFDTGEGVVGLGWGHVDFGPSSPNAACDGPTAFD